MAPRRATDAKRLIRKVLQAGRFAMTSHAEKERDNDKLTDVDIVNVLRGGAVDEAEHENGEWRHRIHTPKIGVVIAFEPDPDEATSEDEIELVIVTVWKEKSR